MEQELKVEVGSEGEAIAKAAPQEDVPDVPQEALEAVDISSSSQVVEDDPELDEIESLTGQRLDDRYLIQEELARGGMGIVFRAQHLSLNRPVVIKVLKSAQTESSSAKARFEREARRACQLDHPNIVTVHDFGYHEDLGYLVMEYVAGLTLYDYIKRNGPLTFAQFAPVAAAIASGLDEAHRQGIVHRDIKASNIMLTFEDGHLRRVKILDFGLAKAEGVAEDDVTRQSALIGTMGAMPPERILCKPTDCRADLYALGVTAYRMITGRRPFVGDDMHVLYQHVHEHPAPLNELLPQGHEYPIMALEWVHRLLAKEPDDRPKDGAQAREWLFETVLDRSVFRMDETKVAWKDLVGSEQYGNQSGTFEGTDPSWSVTSSPSGSYRSLLSGHQEAAIVVAELREEESRREEQQDTKAARSNLPILAGIGALALAGLSAFALTQLSGTPAAAPSATATQAKAPPVKPALPVDNAKDVERLFARVESELERGAYATAENLLTSVRDKLASKTEYQVRAAEFQSRIDIDKNIRKARVAEEKMDIEEAVRLYDAVLSLDAGHSRARDRHENLTSQVLLKISSDPSASEVHVDGQRVGVTPLEKLLPMGFSRVEVRHSGYKSWSTSLVPEGGTRLELAANLRKKGTPKPTNNPKENDPDGLGNESLMD